MLRRTSSFFMAGLSNLGRINHVAIAVPADQDIVQAAAMYKNLFGVNVSEPKEQKEHGVTTVFVEMPNTKLEFLHPIGDKSPIAGFLEKNKMGGMHHICIETPDIAASIAKCKASNIRTLSAQTKIGAHGNPVIFLHPKDCGGVLVELEEVKPQ
ncbi:methylmalonyl-CoA epimerase [Strigomonas culicis]|uniref:Methylmalonyl-CoA epimerase, mitochondrial n=1 Tax=Strigomonas culicis TaxID=28005 RepID=S9TZ50_9TRYP|nr:methylmalonyl-coa epimerase-like protein [Strigomonas culicis]EPY34793.1 methylmalonyl-CoA epimerase [Strigomonas culicis]|eukprot:EPY23812.1 methylmalonyl-coa epimerase-like protein [Strigomonas culicis]